jgi:hypothetical protein
MKAANNQQSSWLDSSERRCAHSKSSPWKRELETADGRLRETEAFRDTRCGKMQRFRINATNANQPTHVVQIDDDRTLDENEVGLGGEHDSRPFIRVSWRPRR